MTGVPRSQIIIAHHFGTPGVSGIWTSPAGYVTLLKSAAWWNNTSTISNCFVFAHNTPTNVEVRFSELQVEGTASGEWSGWIVLNPGDFVGAYSDSTDVHFLLMGAVLAGPNQFPPAQRSATFPINGRPTTPVAIPPD